VTPLNLHRLSFRVAVRSSRLRLNQAAGAAFAHLLDTMEHLALATAIATTVVTAAFPVACAAEGQVLLHQDGPSTLLQVQGSSDEDWRILNSIDLVTWTTNAALGTLLSGETNAPWRSVGDLTTPQAFYRAQKTAGLYDPTLLRTIELTFSQTNWQTLLANGRTTGSNVLGNLAMNNGATNSGVGARYRGNTSYTGLGQGGAPIKKSLNIELNYSNLGSTLMGYQTINLNNAYGDETIMREPLYFDIMRHYTVCPKGSQVKLYINGNYWGVYSSAQQENGDLIKEWFPSNDGDRWRAPNMPAGGPGPGGTTGTSALAYLGTNLATYKANYELKTDNSTNAWERLRHATDVLNTTPTNQLRDQVEEVLAVDRWLWFLVLENVFADDDSYFNKGADYGFYYEPESGRIHPVEHDGNEAFVAGDVQLSPVQGATSATRPLLYRLLAIPELRQRYLAHMRTVLQEYYNPTVMLPLIDGYSTRSIDAIALDPKKGFTMAAYTNDLKALKAFVQQRYVYLTNHAELRSLPPEIVAVHEPAVVPTASDVPIVTAEVRAQGTNGLDSVWLYHRGRSYGRFTAVPMLDDGDHGDGAAGDGVFGADTTNYPAGTKVRFYVEARSANTAEAACFAPARAEEETFHYRVAVTTAAATPVVINEFMASNAHTLADPQGEFDDWIELHNLTGQEVDLTGRYLSDEPNNPRKWAFPAGTTIAANGYLLVWADEDGTATPGLHASFKLAGDGEEIFFTDTDANLNAILDAVAYGAQETDRSYGRTSEDPEVWGLMQPTPGLPNR
jgi:spore coat protein CotH